MVSRSSHQCLSGFLRSWKRPAKDSNDCDVVEYCVLEKHPDIIVYHCYPLIEGNNPNLVSNYCCNIYMVFEYSNSWCMEI